MNSTCSKMTLRGWKISGASGGLRDCALIVPTYRRPVEIVKLLRCLTKLPDLPGEVLIIDGSPDRSVDAVVREWVAGHQFPFELVFIHSPAGLTRQRNVGIDATRREFIFFLDDDCVPEPGYFAALREVFVQDRERQIGAVRGFLTNGINKPLTRLWRLRYALGLVPRGEPGRYHSCGTSGTWDLVEPFRGVRQVDVLAGGASAYRREVFSAHRFSEFFSGYAQGEDLEMSLRLGRHWRLAVCGEARVKHDHAENGRPAGFARGRMAARNRYFIWKRYSPHARLIDRGRFWADHGLSMAYYLAAFLTRPWQSYFLGFAVGTFYGAAECWINPPYYIEPAARPQYAFAVAKLFPHRPVRAGSSCAEKVLSQPALSAARPFHMQH
jgi:GT2 family glycosyltransferase